MQPDLTAPDDVELAWRFSFSGEEPDPDDEQVPREEEDLSGVLAGNYRLVDRLGSGGLGSVWRAEHPMIGSQVAVKVLHPDVCRSQEATRRFVLEAQAVNRIACPNVVRIFDFGQLPNGREYAVMELLQGETLGQRLCQATLPWPTARDIALQLVNAVHTAHQSGVVHRDLKPENVHLGCDPQHPRVKVLDFGIAKLLDASRDDPPAQPGFCVGTPAYAAPEQLIGGPIGPATDVYGCGELLFEMLVGRPPFTGSLKQVVKAKVTREPEPIESLVPHLPVEVAELINAMLSMEPHRRPTTAEVVEALAATMQEDSPAPDPCALPMEPWDRLEGMDTLPNPSLFRDVVWGAGSDQSDEPRPVIAPVVQGRRRRVLIPAFVSVVLAAAAAAGWLTFTLLPADAKSPTPPPSLDAVKIRINPAPRPARLVPPAPTGLAPARATTHELTLRSRPSGALVRVEGRPAGRTPLKLRLPPTTSPLELTFHRAGYRRGRRFVRINGPLTVRVVLRSEAKKLEVKKVDWVDPF